MAAMDPIWTGAIMMLIPVTGRLAHQWIKSWTTLRLHQLDQQAISDRVRCLPAGSRLSESVGGREIVVEVGRGMVGREHE
ncbi:hypothetical protein [Streptomyces sp. SR-10]|uniref:hypothetical protein n=1 Tax=Streptomyces sp. SR-10 TaxID=3416442 RepID=UPI003CF90928